MRASCRRSALEHKLQERLERSAVLVSAQTIRTNDPKPTIASVVSLRCGAVSMRSTSRQSPHALDRQISWPQRVRRERGNFEARWLLMNQKQQLHE